MTAPLCIFCEPDELQQGLFGQTFYYLMQLLPYLHERGIYPKWEVRTQHYGDPPDFVTVPGVLDLAYTPPEGPYRRLTLAEMRRRHAHVLGGDWQALHTLWNSYFRIPRRVLAAAENVLPQGKVLGVHYRGTDKQTTNWDSNPISAREYLSVILEFLEHRPEFDVIFAATDEFAFVEVLRSAVSLPVIALGAVDFHLEQEPRHARTRREKADRALLDCVLLSMCSCVLETSSGLPSFAKLLRPELEIYRCAASKMFGKLYTNMPYFPVAHIPVLPARSSETQALLDRTMKLDWTQDPQGQPFLQPFVARPRWPQNHRVFRVAEQFGVDRVAGLFLRGYR